MAYNPDVLNNFYNNYSDYSKSLAHSGISSSDIARRTYQSTAAPSIPYYLGQGTDYMYNGKYRQASDLEDALIDIHRAGDYLFNWQQIFAGPNASEEEKDKFRFHADKMNILDSKSDFYKPEKWSSGENWGELAKFAVSLPGQMAGGLLQAPGQLIGEAVIGDPYTEYKKKFGSTARHGEELGEGVKQNGHYLIPEYSLDAGQKAGQAINAGINLFGTFTGGTGRVLGTIGKQAFKQGVRREAEKLGGKVNEQALNQALKTGEWRGLTQQAGEAAENVEKWAAKAEKWENRSKGWVRRGYERATGKDSNAAGIGLQIGFDAGEEAAEEFIQQYAEQGGRYKQPVTLKDALNAAAWGAIGGGMMGGGMHIMNYGSSSKFGDAGDPNVNAYSDFAPSEVDMSRYKEMQGVKPESVSPDMVKWYQNKVNSRKNLVKFEASASAKNITVSDDVSPDNATFGDENFVVAWNSSGTGARQLMASKHGATEQNIDELVKDSDNYVSNLLQANPNANGEIATELRQKGNNFTIADALNLIMELNGVKGVKVIVGRSPATKLGGRHAAYITRYTNGNGIGLHIGVYQRIGSDLDGDIDNVFYDTDRWGKNAKLISETLTDGEYRYHQNDDGTLNTDRTEGPQPIDYYYFGITDIYKDNPDLLREKWKPIFDQYDPSGQLMEHYINQFIDILKDKDGKEYRNYHLSSFFTEMMNDLDSRANAINQQLRANRSNTFVQNGRTAWNRLMMTFNNDLKDVWVKIQTNHLALINKNLAAEYAAMQMQYGDDFKIDEKDIANSIMNQGILSGNSIAENQERMALVAYSLISKSGTVIFRQGGQIYYNALSLPEQFWDKMEGSYVPTEENVLRAFIRAQFHMYAEGGAQKSSIEGMIDGLILREALSESGLSRDVRINNAESLQRFQEALCRAANKYNEEYNNANRVMTSRGLVEKYDFVSRATNIEVGSEEFWVLFRRVTENVAVTDVLDSSKLPDSWQTKTFGDILNDYGRNKFVDTSGLIVFDDDSINTFLKDFLADFGRQSQKLELSIKKAWEKIQPLRQVFINKYKPETNTIEWGNDFVAFQKFVWMVNDIMGYDISYVSRFTDENGLLTEFGRSLILADSFEVFENNLLGASIYAQYQPYINILNDPNKTADEKYQVECILSDMFGINLLHGVIASEIVNTLHETGTAYSNTYNMIIDPNRTFSDKKTKYEALFGSVDTSINLFIDGLTSEATEFSFGEMSSRVRKARSHAESATASLSSTNKLIVDKLFNDNSISNASETEHRDLMMWLRRQAVTNRISIDPEVIIAQAHEATMLPHESVEKGVEVQLASGKSAVLKIKLRGNRISYQDDIFGLNFGVVSFNQIINNRKLFLALWADPTMQLEVYDLDGNICDDYSLASMFATVGVTLEQGQMPSYEDARKFFNEYPNLISYFSDCSPNLTENGAVLAQQQDAYKCFHDYQQAYRAFTNDLSDIEETMHSCELEVESYLLNQTWYQPYLIACCSDEIANGMSQTIIRKKMLKIHNDTCTILAYNAQKTHEGMSESEFDTLFKEWKTTTLDELDQGFSDVFYRLSEFQDVFSDSNAVRTVMKYKDELDLQREFFNLMGGNPILDNALKKGRFGNVSEDETVFTEYQETTNELRKKLKEEGELHTDELSNLLSYLRFVKWKDQTPTTELSDDFISRLKADATDKINSDPNLNKQARQDELDNITREIDKLRDECNDRWRIKHPTLRETIDYNNIFELSDFDDVTYLIDKYTRIVEYRGEVDTRTRGDIVKDFLERFYSPNKTQQELEDERNKFIDEQFNLSFQFETNQLNLLAGSNLNANAANLSVKMLDFFRKSMNTVDGIPNTLNDFDLIFEGDQSAIDAWYQNRNVKLHTPDFRNPITQWAISRSIAIDSFGAGALEVADNGGEVKYYTGYTYLPGSTHKENSWADTLTVEQFVQAVDDDPTMLDWQMVNIGQTFDQQNTSNWDYIVVQNNISQLRQMAQDPAQKQTPVYFFHPLKNAHGLSEAHLTRGDFRDNTGREVRRVTEMLEILCSQTMEGMVLKLKKNMGKKDFIVKEKGFDSISKRDDLIPISDFNDPNLFKSSLDKLLVNVRMKYAEELNKEFHNKDTLNDLGWGIYQAKNIACLLLPGIKLTMSDGSKIYVDANRIFSNEDFNLQGGLFSRTHQNNITIVDAEAFMVSPKKQAADIYLACSEDENIRKNQGAREAAALNALQYPEDMNFSSLPVSKILNRMAPVGMHYSTGIEYSDGANAYQNLSEIVSEDATAAKVSPVKEDMLRSHFLDDNVETHRSFLGAAKNAVNILNPEDSSGKSLKIPAIIKVWKPEVRSMYGMNNQEIGVPRIAVESTLSNIDAQLSENNEFSNNYRYVKTQAPKTVSSTSTTNNSVGVALTISGVADLAEKLDWARTTNNDLLIPVSDVSSDWDVIDSVGFVDKKRSIVTLSFNGTKMQFYWLRPRMNRIQAPSTSRGMASLWHVDQTAIRVMLNDTYDIFNVPDGASWALEPMQTIGVAPEKRAIIRTSSLMDAGGVKTIATTQQVRDFLNSVIDSDTHQINRDLDNNGKIRRGSPWLRMNIDKIQQSTHLQMHVIQDEIISYCKWVLTNTSNSTVRSSQYDNAGANKVLCFITNGNGDFAPVIGPSNTMNVYDHCSVEVENGEVKIFWDRSETMKDALGPDGKPVRQHIKQSAFNYLGNKGNLIVAPETFRGGTYIEGGIGVRGFVGGAKLSQVFSSDTLSGRLVGRDEDIIKTKLYYLDKLSNGSEIFVSDKVEGNPEDYRLNDYIQQQVAANDVKAANGEVYEGWSTDKLFKLFHGDRNIIKEIADGALRFSEDEDKNLVIQKLALRCWNERKPFVHMITNVTWSSRKDKNGNYIVKFDNTHGEFLDLLRGWDINDVFTLFYKRAKFAITGGKVLDTLCFKGKSYKNNKPLEQLILDENGKPNCIVAPNGLVYTTMLFKKKGTNEQLPIEGFFDLLIDVPKLIADVGTMITPSGVATLGFQNSIMNGLEYRLGNTELKRLMGYGDFAYQNVSRMIDEVFDTQYSRHDDSPIPYMRAYSRNRDAYDEAMSRRVIGNYNELRWEENVANMRRTREYNRRILDHDGKTALNPSEDQRIVDWVEKIRGLIKYNAPFHMIDNWCKAAHGYTYDWKSDDNNDVTIDAWVDAAEHVYESLVKHKIPCTTWDGNLSPVGDRAALPWLSNFEYELLIKKSEFFRDAHGNAANFKKAVMAEGMIATDIIKSQIPFADRAKQRRLMEYIEWIHRVNGDEFTDNDYLFGGLTTADMIRDMEQYVENNIIIGNLDEMQRATALESARRGREKIKHYRQITRQQDRMVSAPNPNSANGKTTTYRYDDNAAMNKYLDTLATMSQMMAIANPYIVMANTIERGVKQTVMNSAMRMAISENPILNFLTPYKFIDKSHAFTEDELNVLVNDEEAMLFIDELRKIGWNGLMQEFMAKVSDPSVTIIDFIRERRAKENGLERAADYVFTAGSGFNIGLKTQTKIFLQRTVQFFEESQLDYWFQPVTIRRTDENGNTVEEKTTLLKARLLAPGGFSSWLQEQFGAKGESIGMQETINALQSARAGDMAQNHTLAIILNDLFRRWRPGKFVSTTLISKFPQYAFNKTDKYLNWVLPTSSFYYVMTERLANTKYGKEHNIADAQHHKNLIEAITVDMLHMGPGLLAMVMLACAAMQPPDDDKYFCNYEEWLFCGIRIRDEWWISDLLGPIIPIMCFAESCRLGKPMFTLLTDGSIEACYNNPFMRATDILDLCTDSEGNIFDQYKMAQKQYDEAPGGGPESALEFLSANAPAMTLKYISQFFTPSFVKDVARMGNEEHSYKTVYARTDGGSRKEGDEYTEKVTYSEAMLRKVTRSNPFAAVLMNFILPSETGTGYLEQEMPRTLYYDQYQLDSAKANDEKSAMEILTTLQRYENNMDALQRTGFYLSKEKKAEVSELIWDMYYQAKTDWNTIAGNSDFRELGDGDWDAGKAKYYELKETYQNMQRYWSNFYNNVIKNSYLSKGMQRYYREKTTYDMDATGEIYATGFKQNGLLSPLIYQTAPGTINDPQGTAGYENNFNTISNVTGEPLDQRALIPLGNDYEEWPSFSEWSADKSGNSFSNSYYNNGGTSSGSEASDKTSSSGSNSGSGSSRRSGSSSGGGRSGGSGGSSSSGGRGYYQTPPRISIQGSSNYPISPSRIMGSNRRIESDDISYLRPGFETKGSREAYKRGDI